MQYIPQERFVIIGVGDKFAWLDKSNGEIGALVNTAQEAVQAGMPADSEAK